MISFPQPDVEQFFRMYLITRFAVSKDESRVVFTSNMNGKFNLWAIDLPNQYPYPLTYSNQTSSFIQFDPEGRHILTSFDRDGDENYHLYAIKPEGGQPYPLRPANPEDKFFFAYLSEDGERIYYNTSQHNPQYLNIRRYNLQTQEDELLWTGEQTSTWLVAVSPDESNWVMQKHFANTHIVGYHKVGDELVCVTPSADVDHTTASFVFIDNNTVLFVTNYEDENAYVASYTLDTQEFQVVCKIDHENVSEIKWHKESRTIYIVTEQSVEDQMYTYSLDQGELQSVSNLPVSVIEQVHVAASGHVYILGRSATTVLNIYVVQEGEWTMLTQNRVTGLSKEELVEPEVVQYHSFDGLPIESLLFRAKPEVANGYTIFWPHGGPQASERKFFRSMFQFLLANGYTIFAPNFRGSTGYGASFVKMVEGDWGEGPRLDCVAGIEWLFANDVSERDKLFVVGGSYGGYMTLLLAGRHAEYFRAAVNIFGVSNLFTFIESVPEHWKPIMKRWLGDPIEDKERLTRDNPITYLDQMVKPMLVIQGANDPRVVKAESDQIVEALQQKGVEVEYLVLDDEGHGFSKKENEIAVYRKMLQFLDAHK